MTDAEAINEAYAGALKGLYQALFDAVVTDRPGAVDGAKERFSAGLALARQTRDIAISLL